MTARLIKLSSVLLKVEYIFGFKVLIIHESTLKFTLEAGIPLALKCHRSFHSFWVDFTNFQRTLHFKNIWPFTKTLRSNWPFESIWDQNPILPSQIWDSHGTLQLRLVNWSWHKSPFWSHVYLTSFLQGPNLALTC